MNIDNIIASTLKVTASQDLNIENDLNTEDSNKTLNQLFYEKKQQAEEIERSEEKNNQN
jgi:hypothetical protein